MCSHDQDVKQVREEVKQVHEEVTLLREEMKCIHNDIHKLMRTCGRMDNHISFVDGVYNQVRHPIQSLIDRFYSNVEMPTISYEDEVD